MRTNQLQLQPGTIVQLDVVPIRTRKNMRYAKYEVR